MFALGVSGSTHDFFCWDSSNNVYNVPTLAFVAWVDGNVANYRITATELGTSGDFTGTAPSGAIRYELRLRGASLAASPVLWSDFAAIQTGDSYEIVNDSSFGNSKLVRSTTPANTLDVSSTGEAGLDFNNVKDATGAHTLTNITVPAVTATGAVSGNVGGNLAGSIGSLSTQAKADVNAEVDTALTDYGALKPTTPGRTLDVDTAHKAPATIAAGDIATDAITAVSFAAAAVTKIQAGLSTLATSDLNTLRDALRGGGWTDETFVSIQALLDDVKSKTDNLPSVPFVHTAGKVWALDGDGNPLFPLSGYTTPPTPHEIDIELSEEHGGGSWEGGGGAPTVEEIDAELTANHGTGAWNSGLNSDQQEQLDVIEAQALLITVNNVTVESGVDQNGDTITVRQSDSWAIGLNGLGDITGATVYFGVKSELAQPDNDAYLLVKSGVGLIRLNKLGTGFTAGQASITVTDAEEGNIVVAVQEAVTAQLLRSTRKWGVKIIQAGEAETRSSGVFITVAEIVAALT